MPVCKEVITLSVRREGFNLETSARHLGANMSPGSCDVGRETPGTTWRGREEERRASEIGPREGSCNYFQPLDRGLGHEKRAYGSVEKCD